MANIGNQKNANKLNNWRILEIIKNSGKFSERDIQLSTVEKLCDYFEISLNEFFNDSFQI